MILDTDLELCKEWTVEQVQNRPAVMSVQDSRSRAGLVNVIGRLGG